LAENNDPDLWKVLNETIKNPSAYVRTVTLRYLGEKFGVEAIDLLILALKDKDSNTRKTATLILGNIGDPRAVEPLVELLTDESPEVSWEAALALEKIPERELVFSYLKDLVSTYSSIPAVAYLLAQYGGTEMSAQLQKSVPFLITYLQHKERDPIQRLAAAKALDAIGGSLAITALLDVIADQDDRVSYVVIQALARRGNTTTVQAALSEWEARDGKEYSKGGWRYEEVRRLVAAKAALGSDELKLIIVDQPDEHQENTRAQIERQLNNMIDRYAPDTHGG